MRASGIVGSGCVRVAAVVCVLAFCLPVPAVASEGTLAGRVMDFTGAALPGAEVWASTSSASPVYKTVTDCGGYYRLFHLEAGTYTVKFGAKYFRTQTKAGVPLIRNQVSQLDVKLEVGQVGGAGPDIEAFSDPAGHQHGAPSVNTAAGIIRGVVRDERGVVPARISASDFSSGKSYETSTDSEGHYQLSVVVGHYCVTVELLDPAIAPSWQIYHGGREASLGQSNESEVDFLVTTLPSEWVEVCSASCPVATGRQTDPVAKLYLYAAENVVSVNSELGLTLTLTNNSRHSIFVPTDKWGKRVLGYQINAAGKCACPGHIGNEYESLDRSRTIKLKPGKSITQLVSIKITEAMLPLGTYWVTVDLAGASRHGKSEAQSALYSNSIYVSVMQPRVSSEDSEKSIPR